MGMLQIGITVKPKTKQTCAQTRSTILHTDHNYSRTTWKHNRELQTRLNPADLNHTRILSVSNLIPAPQMLSCL